MPPADVAEVGADRDAAQARLEADEPAARGGDADRAAEVAAVGERRPCPRRRRPRCRPTSRPARGRDPTGCGSRRSAAFSVTGRRPSSGVFVLPTTIAPASRSRRTCALSWSATQSPNARAALGRRQAFGRREQVLDPDGTPQSGRASPGLTASASASARSGHSATKAFSARVQPLDRRERRLDELARGHLARAHELPPARGRSARGGRRSPAWRGESTTAPRAYESSRAASRSRSRCTRCITLSSITPSLRSARSAACSAASSSRRDALVARPTAPRSRRRRRRRTGRGSGRAEAVASRAAARRCLGAHGPVLEQLLEPGERRLGGLDARLRLLALGAAVVARRPRTRISQRQRQALEHERREDDAEREEDDQVAMGEVGREGERGDQRDGAADSGPRDERRVLPRRVGVVLADRPERPPRHVR